MHVNCLGKLLKISKRDFCGWYVLLLHCGYSRRSYQTSQRIYGECLRWIRGSATHTESNKSQAIIFWNHRKMCKLPDILLKGYAVPFTDTVKYLSVQLDQTNFRSHIESIEGESATVSRALRVVRKNILIITFPEGSVLGVCLSVPLLLLPYVEEHHCVQLATTTANAEPLHPVAVWT